MSPQKKRILITGASGFIGSRLVGRLAPKNELICIYGRAPKPHIKHKLKWIQYDFAKTIDTEVLPRKVDMVVHLAAMTKENTEATRERLFRVNTGATTELLEYASRAKAKLFVYASTGGVYGYRSEPIGERQRADPVDFYAATKYAGEVMTEQYRNDFNVVILRFFFPYGPSQNHHLIPGIIQNIERREPITFFNQENPVINPIYISDVVEAIARAIALDRTMILNIAGEERVSIPDMARMMGKIMGVRPIFKNIRDPKVSNLIGDTTNMERELKFKPLVNLRTGLRRSIPTERSR